MRKHTEIVGLALLVLAFTVSGCSPSSQPVHAQTGLRRVPTSTQESRVADAGNTGPRVEVLPETGLEQSAPAPSSIDMAAPASIATIETPQATATPAVSVTEVSPPTQVPASEPVVTTTPEPAPPTRLVIPSTGLDTEVVGVGWREIVADDGTKRTEWEVASFAAGWHETSAKPGEGGNVVIAAHNNIEGEVFLGNDQLELGDVIKLYAGEREFNYTVVDKFVVAEKNVPYEQRVANNRWIGDFPEERLTLLSCWPPTDNTHRLFIIATPQQAVTAAPQG